MKVLKRPLSIILTALMLMSMITVGTVTAGAANGKVSDYSYDYTYVNEDNNNKTTDEFLDETGMDYRDWNQQDSRWASIPLGVGNTAGETVGHAGCTITSICKLLIELGFAKPTSLNPGTFTQWLNNNGGFVLSGTYAGSLNWDVVQTYCQNVLNKKFTIDTEKVFNGAGSSDDTQLYRWAGTGENNIIKYDSTGYTLEKQAWRLSAYLDLGYHLVVNVHNNGAHWVAIDEIATKNSGSYTDANGRKVYNTFYVMNSWYGGSTGDDSNSRDTLQNYLDNSTTYNTTMKGMFARVAAFKTTDSTGNEYAQNSSIYSNTDEYKKWSRFDARWAANVLDNPSNYKAESIGDWGQEILAISKDLIQAGVKDSDSFTPADCLTALNTASAIETSGNKIGRAKWDKVADLDSEILSSGTAYSTSTSVSSVKDEMLQNIEKNGYHYVIHKNASGNADDTWLAVDEKRSLAENDIYVLSSNADVSANSGKALSGTFAEAYYFTTEPAKTVYLDPSGSGVDDSDATYIYAWTFKDGAAFGDGKWLTGTVDSKGLIKFEGALDNINFVRMDKNASNLPNWDAKWNQTANLDTDNGDLYTLTGFADDTYNTLLGTWTVIKGTNRVYVYTKPLLLRGDYDVYLWNWDDYGTGWANEYTETEDGYRIYTNVKDNFKAFVYAKNTTPPANQCTGYIAQSNRGNSAISYGDLLVLDKVSSSNLVDYQYDYDDIDRTKSYEDIRLDEKQWENVTLGTSTASGDLVKNYTQVQEFAKLVKQAFPNSQLDVADFAAAYCDNNGSVIVNKANVKAWGFSWYKDEYNKDDHNGAALNVSTISGATEDYNIYNYLRNGHHVLLRLNNSASTGTNVANEWVVVDESRTLAANGEQIYIYRTTNDDLLNKGTTLQSTNAGITRILLFDGGENPCLDYRYWSRYDTKWKDYNLVKGGSDEKTSVRYLGAAAAAMTKLLLQAGCRGWDFTGDSNDFSNYNTSNYENSFKYDIEDFVGYMLSINAFAPDGGIDWTKLHNFNHSDIESANSDDNTPVTGTSYHSAYSGIPHKSNAEQNFYHFFAVVGETVFDYPDSHDLQSTAQLISGMSDYTYDAAQKEKLIQAVKNGYHLMIRAQSAGGAGTWVAVDEKTTIQNNYSDIYVMDSERNVSKNVMTLTDWLNGAEGTTVNRNNKFWRVVAYTGGTKELYDDVQDDVVDVEQIDSVTKTALLPKTSDPAFISADTVNNYYTYAYDKVADLVLKLNGATIGYKYRYALFDSREDAQTAAESFENLNYAGYTYYDVNSTAENTVDDIMTVNLVNQLSTKNPETLENVKNKYVVVQTIVLDDNDVVSSYSNTLTASLAYKAEETSKCQVNFFRNSPAVPGDIEYESVTVNSGDSLDELTYYEKTFDLGNGYVFKGWYEDKDTEANPVNINRVFESDTNLYAHWINVNEVSKNSDDDNIIDGNYSGYGLKGVQIRKEGEDSNHVDENGDPIVMPGGLRFITSLSQSLLDEIDSLDGSVDGTNVEYGYVATKEIMAKGVYEHYMGTQTIPESYKLKFADTFVNGENTLTSAKADRTVNNDYRYVTNVNCTSADYDENAESEHRKYDHKKYNDYRLYSMVITYEDESAEDKGVNIIARPYLKYTDVNGLERYRYDEYVGNSNVCGGCCVSYNSVETFADKVGRQESE